MSGLPAVVHPAVSIAALVPLPTEAGYPKWYQFWLPPEAALLAPIAALSDAAPSAALPISHSQVPAPNAVLTKVSAPTVALTPLVPNTDPRNCPSVTHRRKPSVSPRVEPEYQPDRNKSGGT
jgi:hypothetical protein